MSSKFPAHIYEKLGWYVYALVDPSDGKPFYIGKGKGDRVFTHKSGDQTDLLTGKKSNRIAEIEANGSQVTRLIIRWDLSDEMATAIEAALIDFCNICTIDLTNVVRGRHSNLIGAVDANELILRLAALPLEQIIPEDQGHIIFVNVGRTLAMVAGESPEERCYNAAREAWGIDENKISALRYVAAEKQGLIVGVFKVDEDGWYQRESDKKWCFKGAPAAPEYADRYLGKLIKKDAGDQARFRYNIRSM